MRKKMSLQSFFVYSWHVDDAEKEVTSIRAYGLNKENENVCLRIDDFTPYVYVQLPELPDVQWNEHTAQRVAEKIDELLGQAKPLKRQLVFKNKLYYAHLTPNNTKKMFPFLFLSFSSVLDIRLLTAKLTKPLYLPTLYKGGVVKLKIHENNAPVFLQLTCCQDIPTAGWVQFFGKPIVSEEEKVTNCRHEYAVKYKTLSPLKNCNAVVTPLILSYDIEVYSSNPNKMPSATTPKDVVFQISCVLVKNGQNETQFDKTLFSLCNPNPEMVGEDVNLFMYDSEVELLLGFIQFIQEKQPNIICGYNIFTFDIPYMITRAKQLLIFQDFDRQGFDKYGHAKEKTISWSSSAYKNQSFLYLEAEGRLFVDLLPIIKRDYKLNNYSLKTVADNFLGETKDPLTPKGIFKCYDLGKLGGEKGSKAMGIVGKYCVQDSALVLKLFEKLQIWFGLTEMASICSVPVFDLITRGQQLKVFSQIYKKCMAKNVVVEREGYETKEDEHYQGAHVFEPIPGVYDCVVPFDFASLYPSIIIAFNIDYSTLIPENSDIPESDCHIFEWDEHIGCIHEEKKRKVKPKHILCGHRRFKFLKTHKGILPMLLEDLLAARKNTRSEMKEIEKKLKSGDVSSAEKEELRVLLNVLDKRQLSYKISANSAYGAMGVSTKGYLPLMPGAMCVTAKGRQSIELVARLIPEQYGGKLVYGDTDSNYVVFPALKTPQEIWAHAEKVSEEISKHFPKPMKLEFEGVIYWRFLILTMKRYMSLKCDREGNVEKKIEKKGVLLSRRDNSNFVRTVYADIIMKIFDKATPESILEDTIEHIKKLCSHGFSATDFVITKSVGAIGENPSLTPVPIPNKKSKGMLGNYTVPLLSDNPTEKAKQLLQKEAVDDKDFYTKCLPAQVQLAEKIRRRGGRVDVGTRLEYVVLKTDNSKAKQYDKIESIEYYKEYASVLSLDFMYYLKALASPLDQVLQCTVGNEGKDFTHTIYKQQLVKEKVLAQLLSLFEPKLIFADDNEEKLAEDEIFLFTDGASKGNPGKAGAGAVLMYANGVEIVSECKYLDKKTNNEAEYEALILGINMCMDVGIDTRNVHLRADSELMIKQLNGNYKTRNQKLRILFEKVRHVQFKSVNHIFRENNKRADELANLAIQNK